MITHVDIADARGIELLCTPGQTIRLLPVHEYAFWYAPDLLPTMSDQCAMDVTCPKCKRIVWAVKRGNTLESARAEAVRQ